MWSVRVTDHVCIVAQQLYHEGVLEERLGLCSKVPCV